ncbi:MAG: hybrid sensor histidine kinase/response regulator [Comamonadaceae bacterium]|nr:MAG: hybrid sensor histidine kinase/response regulator [Comamonadaceae bacterium]
MAAKASDSVLLPDETASAPPGEAPHALDLDLAVRRRLLGSLADRGSSEAAAIVIPGVLCWFYSRGADPVGLLVWWAAFATMTLFIVRSRRRFRADAALPDAVAVPRWERVFQHAGLVAGLMWVLPVAITLQSGTTEFKLFLYLVLCSVIASAATFLAPLPGIFWRFFLAMYVPMTAALYWFFPLRWPYLLPLLLLYGAIIVRHAWGGRLFVVQQVQREQERQQLAEGYRIAKEQAERALEEKNRFISTTSHDLRQPLHAMGLLMETALQRNGDAQLAPVLRDVQECVRSLSFMFNALMDLSRLESGSFVARREDVSVRALFEDVTTVFAPDAAVRGLRLRRYLPHRREPRVRADPALLRQMVFNLTQNALRYTVAGGVLLGVRAHRGQWRIEVWDTGAGVAQEDRHSVYAPYFRGGQWSGGAEGHGLGLAVVARSAQLIGAEHGFESTPGRGSCFWLNLIAVPDVPEGAQGAEAAGGTALGAPQHAATGRMESLSGTCLLVEDDPQVASALAHLLQSWGLRVKVAATGAQAVARVERGFVPDAVLCDHRLSGGENGFAVLQALLARCGHARGAMVSAEQGAPELLQAEDDGYLVFRKPLAPDVLYAVLARWLNAAHARRGSGTLASGAQRAGLLP